MKTVSTPHRKNSVALIIGVMLVYVPLFFVYAQFDEASVTDCSDGNGQLDPALTWPEKNPKTGKIGLLGKPCDDTTASGKTYAGKCTALNFCKAETADKKSVKDAKEFEKETLKASSGNNDLQQIHKVSYDPGLQTDEVPTPSNEQSFLSRYGYTPETLENLQKMSEQGTNLQELFERGDYKMEHTGVPLQYDNQGRLTEETYKALEKNIGTLQDLPDGSQYSDHSGKPALWQPGAQATGWAGKGLGDVGQAQGFWERAWDGTKEFVGNLFGNNEEPQAGAFPEEPSLWKSAIETAGWTKELRETDTQKQQANNNDQPKAIGDAKTIGASLYYPGGCTVGKDPGCWPGYEGGKLGSRGNPISRDTPVIAAGYESGYKFGDVVRITNPRTGDMQYAVVGDVCPACGRTIDLASGLANKVGIYDGRPSMDVELISRGSSWKQGLAQVQSWNSGGTTVNSNLYADALKVNYAPDWSAYRPLDLNYSLPPPQLAASAPEFEVPGPYAPALVQEYQIPGPFAPALITEYQTGGYDIPTFYADYAAPEPIPAYPSGVEFTGQPAPESTGVGAVPYPDGAAFTAQPEPDEEHSQARQLLQSAIDRGQDWYQSVNDGLQALWDQEVTRRIAGDFNMADNEWPLTATEEAFAQKEAVRAAETERADKAKWQAAYEQLVNTYQDPIGEFSESAVTAKDIERAYDDSARTNDPNHLTPSDGVRPEVADNEQAPTPDQKQSLEKAIADARDELSKAETKQAEPMIVEVKKPRGADAKTLAEWYKENDKQLSSREQRAADYDASLAGCGSGTYRGTACQNAWLLKRYQDEAWSDAKAVAVWNEDRFFEEQSGNAKDENERSLPEQPKNAAQELIDYLKSRKTRGVSPPDDLVEDVAHQPPFDQNMPTENPTAPSDQTPNQSFSKLASRAYDTARDTVQSAWGSVQGLWRNLQTPSESVPLGDAPEPENIVGDYAPQDFSVDNVTRNNANAAPDFSNDASKTEDVAHAARNKEPLSQEDALAVKDAVDDAANDAAMEKEKAAKTAEKTQKTASVPENAALATLNRMSQARQMTPGEFEAVRRMAVSQARLIAQRYPADFYAQVVPGYIAGLSQSDITPERIARVRNYIISLQRR